MPKLPRIFGKDTVRALQRAGFKIFDQTGSHIYLHKFDGVRFGPRVTVVVHGNKILAPKTLKSILKATELSIEEFIELL
ncbi:MAG: type II toxin-antitoxin system HicA family toxin [Elusimicrobiota bacterium]|nr:type II toxin-antitoxin system HicA family toxin [Elusimicrobiota bacterium]